SRELIKLQWIGCTAVNVRCRIDRLGEGIRRQEAESALETPLTFYFQSMKVTQPDPGIDADTGEQWIRAAWLNGARSRHRLIDGHGIDQLCALGTDVVHIQ